MFGGKDKERDQYQYLAFNESTNKASDRINFEDGYDRIGISLLDPNTNSTRDQEWTVVNSFTQKAGQIQWDHLVIGGKKETWIELDATGDARPEMTIILKDHITITLGDFIL